MKACKLHRKFRQTNFIFTFLEVLKICSLPTFEGTVRVILNDPPCKESIVRFPTLETFIWSEMRKIPSFSDSKTVYFWVSPSLLINKKCESHIRRETASENIHFKEKNGYVISTYPDKSCRVPLYIGHCHICMEDHLKLRLQSL